jgi:hypothetical protein
MSRPVLRKLLVLWLGWAILLLAFQNIAGMRLQPDRPDYALQWNKALYAQHAIGFPQGN